MSDKIVFDIETKNSFLDVGGRDKLLDLDISVVGVYSYSENDYFCFDENELEKLEDMLKRADLLIGYSSKVFDAPLLNKYFEFNLEALPQFDILEKISDYTGRKIKMDLVAKANLGISKTSHGMESIEMYRRGDIEELKNYCLQDVKITKGLFDLINKKRFLWVPEKDTGKLEKIPISFEEKETKQKSLI